MASAASRQGLHWQKASTHCRMGWTYVARGALLCMVSGGENSLLVSSPDAGSGQCRAGLAGRLNRWRFTMTMRTARIVKPAACAKAPSSRKPAATSPIAADGSKTTKGTAASPRKAEVAKTKQKLKATVDASAAKETKVKAGARTSIKSATRTEAMNTAGSTKSATVMSMLRGAEGITLEAIRQATGWQAHSVRGFLSGTVRKKQGMALISERGEDGIRRYRIDDVAAAQALP